MSVEITKKRLDAAVQRWQRDKRHLSVRFVGSRAYRVTNGDGKKYTIHFFINPHGKKCASCDCKCGYESEFILCVHVAAALMLHCIRVRQNPANSIGAAHPSFCDEIHIDHEAEARDAEFFEELCGEGCPDALVENPPLEQSGDLYPDELTETLDPFDPNFYTEGMSTQPAVYFDWETEYEARLLREKDPEPEPEPTRPEESAILFKPESAAKCERIGKIRI